MYTLRFLVLILMIPLLSYAGYDKGKQIFEFKCSSCHAGHISADKLKKNFFEEDNKLLKLKAPSVNMLAYAIMDGPKHIGDPDDPEMQQIEIEEYLKDMLYNPKPANSICDENFAKYYDVKKSMKGEVTSKEIIALSRYFMDYKTQWRKAHPQKKHTLSKSYNEGDLLNDATKENKRIIIMASSGKCHFCKQMKREVLDLEVVQKDTNRDFILIEIDIDKMKLPFGLQKSFRGITPTFFFLSKEGKLLNKYPGSWNVKDWYLILRENRKHTLKQARKGRK